MKVLIIGPYPPPYGGISVHIKRMKSYLERHQVRTLVYNEDNSYHLSSDGVIALKSYKLFLFKLPFIKSDIFHFHTISKNIRMVLGFYSLLGKKIVLTIHGESMQQQLSSSSPLKRKIFLCSLNRIHKIICVNPKTKDDLIDFGIPDNRICVLPAYINPIELNEDFGRIPQQVYSFLEKPGFSICSNGFIKFHNNEDLYGVDMLIDLIDRLTKNKIDVKLLFALLGSDSMTSEERNYYEKLKHRISDLGLNDKIYIFEVVNTELYPLLKNCHIFIRPTNVDGYGVSIAEAIHYKLPSIASDVCKRPEGSIIFKSRDIDDLYSKTYNVLSDINGYKSKLGDITSKDYASELLMIYNELGHFKK